MQLEEEMQLEVSRAHQVDIFEISLLAGLQPEEAAAALTAEEKITQLQLTLHVTDCTTRVYVC